jgi:hypothetical protein
MLHPPLVRTSEIKRFARRGVAAANRPNARSRVDFTNSPHRRFLGHTRSGHIENLNAVVREKQPEHQRGVGIATIHRQMQA